MKPGVCRSSLRSGRRAVHKQWMRVRDQARGVSPSSHENGNESQQKDQNATGHRQHDGHERNDFLDGVGIVGFVVGLWGGHVRSLNF
jgi:hypothetical protein